MGTAVGLPISTTFASGYEWNARHSRQVVERRQVDHVRVVNVAALVANHGEELLVGVVIDQRGVDHDERLLVGAVGGGVHDRAVDDVDLRRRDVQRLRALHDQRVDARELPIGDADRVAEELALPDRLEHPHRAGHRQLDRLDALEGRARLPIHDVGVLVPAGLGSAARALTLFSCDEAVKVQARSLRHGMRPFVGDGSYAPARSAI